MMRKIVLHGALGNQFGQEFMLDVASPREALRALIVQIKGFRQRLKRRSLACYSRRAIG